MFYEGILLICVFIRLIVKIYIFIVLLFFWLIVDLLKSP